MTKQLTVGYDGSASSTEAVLWAAAEASARSASLRIISCYDIPYAGEMVGGWTATEACAGLLDASRAILAEVSAVVAKANPSIEIVTEASAGPASYSLVDGVDPDDLVVVGSSGHRGAAAFWLGSTPRYVVRHSPCPVVVVRGSATRGRPDRIVVGVDGSPAAERALQWAGNEADLHKVSLLIVHGWSYPYLAIDPADPQARDLTKIDAACLLERSGESAREEFAADIQVQLVEAGPANALLETVRDGDLLVVGSRGRGSFAANLFGSTVNSVLDRSDVPVVVVRGTEEG